MKRIKLYQLAIILAISLSASVFASGEKKPAAFGTTEEAVQPPQATTVTAAASVTSAAPAASEANHVQFPYVGEIIGNELNLRSGAGMNYYSCGKISAPTRVVVVGEQFSWSQILPPPGSFSWIFKQYVQTDANASDVGIVNADNVRVYAGAEDRDAMVSDSVQLTLNKGQKVRLIGQAVGDYYKIAPPEGATLWTSSQYIKYLRKADEIDIKVPAKQEETKAAATTVTAKPGVMIDQVDANSRNLERYYVLAKQLDDEKSKPLADQNFTQIRADMEALAADSKAGKAAEYAQYTMKTIARYELAKQASGVMENQKSELQKQLDEIEKERQLKKQSEKHETRFAVTGTFKISALYLNRPDIKRYLVLDETQTPVCYAQPVGDAEGMDLTEFYGKKVGLVGEITTDTTSNFALISFTEIQLIKDVIQDSNEVPTPDANKSESPDANASQNQDPNENSKNE